MSESVKYIISVVDRMSGILSGVEKKTNSLSGAMKRLAGVVAAAFAVKKIIDFSKRSVAAYNTQEQALAQVRQGLISTEGVSGRTFDQLVKQAQRLQSETLFGDEQILQQATAQLLTFTNIAGDQFDRTQEAALDLATRLGGDLQSASIQLGKALNDPVANLSALSRSGIQFSEEQKKVIKELATTNRLADAQTLILDELNKQYGGAAKAAAAAGTGGITQLKNELGDTSELIGARLIKGLNNSSSSLRRLNQVAQRFIAIPMARTIKDEQSEVNQLASRLIMSETPQKERVAIYNRLKEVSPSVIKGISLESMETGKLVENLREYNNEAAKRIVIANLEQKELKQQTRLADAMANSLTFQVKAMDQIREVGLDNVLSDNTLSTLEKVDKAISILEDRTGGGSVFVVGENRSKEAQYLSFLQGTRRQIIKSQERENKLSEKGLTLTERIAAMRQLLSGEDTPLSQRVDPITGQQMSDIQKGIDTTITAAAPKNFIINIDTLIRDGVNIHSETIREGASDMKEQVTRALLQALNDSQNMAR